MFNDKHETDIIRVFEDRQQKVKLSQQNLKDLIEMREIIGENNIIIQADGKLLIRHYIGFVQINKTRLLVYPKVARGLTSEDEFEQSFKVIMKMLSYTNYLGIKQTPNTQNISQFQNDLMEFYIRMFVYELTTQIQRDINRGYNNCIENQSFIKGKVDFNETLKRNSFRKHLHYVRYDDFNENTILNRIFKSVLELLIKKTRTKKSKIDIKQLLLWMEDVEKISITDDLWNRVVFTRQNVKYKTAFNMAKLFFYGNSPNIKDGNTSVISFLVPVNQLFEVYLFKLLEANVGSETVVKYQGPIDYLARMDNRKYLQLRPDITLLKNDDVYTIVDAKYKLITDSEDVILLSQGDVYQMLAYSVRYKCDRIYLIYPKAIADKDMEYEKVLTIENYDKVVTVHLLKLDIEENPDMVGKRFVKQLDVYEENSNG